MKLAAMRTAHLGSYLQGFHFSPLSAISAAVAAALIVWGKGLGMKGAGVLIGILTIVSHGAI